MEWNRCYEKGNQPTIQEIGNYIASPLWEELSIFLEENYKVAPKIEHSICSGAPGWNVKYKKGGRSLCTLYPNKNFYTALVSIGIKEQQEAELLLNNCSDYTKELYKNTNCFNGARWLMINVTSKEILEDTKALISTRASNK